MKLKALPEGGKLEFVGGLGAWCAVRGVSSPTAHFFFCHGFCNLDKTEVLGRLDAPQCIHSILTCTANHFQPQHVEEVALGNPLHVIGCRLCEAR